MKAAGKKEKGRRLELKFAKMIREKGLDPDAKRMMGSGAFAHFKADIWTKLPYHFECKNQERVSMWAWWDQAREHGTVQKPPVLVFTSNLRPIMVTMDANDFLNIVLEARQWEDAFNELKKENE